MPDESFLPFHESPISRHLTDLSAPLLDGRLAAVDARAALADLQIRGDELKSVAKTISDKWPEVQALRCSIRERRPFFTIHLRDFSQAAQRRHWPLADEIDEIIGSEECRFLFLPKTWRRLHPGEIEIYNATDDASISPESRAA